MKSPWCMASIDTELAVPTLLILLLLLLLLLQLLLLLLLLLLLVSSSLETDTLSVSALREVDEV